MVLFKFRKFKMHVNNRDLTTTNFTHSSPALCHDHHDFETESKNLQFYKQEFKDTLLSSLKCVDALKA